MKEIPLANNRGIALVDDADYDHLTQFNWNKSPKGYCQSTIKGQTTLMHRLLMGAEKGQEIDHINRDKLDNRKSNLRFITSADNTRNTVRIEQAKGYSWNKQRKKWHAKITVNGESIFLGQYDAESDARKAYEQALHHIKM